MLCACRKLGVGILLCQDFLFTSCLHILVEVRYGEGQRYCEKIFLFCCVTVGLSAAQIIGIILMRY